MTTITKEAAVSVGLVICLLGLVASATWFVATQSAKVDGLRDQVALLREELRSFRGDFVQSIDEAAGDRWRKKEMKAWAEDLRTANPSIVVPPVRDM